MNRRIALPRLIACALLSGFLLHCGGGEKNTKGAKAVASETAFQYPETRRQEVVDDYHGTEVRDAYRWLEDDGSDETANWVSEQNKLTFSFLESIPERKTISQRITKLWDYEKFGTPQEKSGRFFYMHNSGLQNHSVLYWADSLDAEPKVLLDPNTLSSDGTVALAEYSVSDDGKHIAYGVQSAGSDWAQWHVRNVESGKDLPDTLDYIKFSIAAWNHESTGLYYGRYPKPKEGASLTEANFDQRIYFHKLGTAQSEDTVVFETPNQPKWNSAADVSEDGRYLIVDITKGTGDVNHVHYRDLKAKGASNAFTELIGNFDAMYRFIGNQGPVFWFHTDNNAPRGRIIAIDTRSPAPENWKEIVPQSDATLRGARLVGGSLVTNYMRDAYSEVILRDLTGKAIKTLELPGIGSVSGFAGSLDATQSFYSFSNYTTPKSVYRYDFKSGQSSLYKRPTIDFDASQFDIKQVFYKSKDGTKVPMFLVHKKDLVLDGNNPTLLYGYGGFNISLTPRFSVGRLVWLEMGGILAIPNLRGGGEYGEEWHKAGTKLVKQNVFDDFIAAAQWLVVNKYTSARKLAISGRSNGGLLVGACMTQRPELFGAALPGVGVMDMLRFHKFTIGWAWTDDYGSSDDPEQFKALLAYSPYHNLKAVDYPATLITTADHDDRVVPAHSFKFAAELQRVHTGNTPVMIRIETKAGHGAGKPTSKRIEDISDNYAFLVKALGMNKES